MQKLMLLIGVVLLLPSCSQINERLGLKDDHIAEEMIEDAVKEKVGVDVDLTPVSPEAK